MTPTTLQEVVRVVRGLNEEQLKEVLAYMKKMREENGNEATAKPNKKKIWEKIAEMREKLPKNAFDEIPTDGSLNHDHYLYGSPKREQK